MLRTRKRKLFVLAVIIIIFGFILSLFVYLNQSTPYQGKIQSVIVGTQYFEPNSLILIAESQRYFTNNGLNVTLKYYTNGPDAVNGMLQGKADVATAAEFVLTEQVLQNASIYTFANIAQYLSLFIVGRTDKGINSVSDLKGKTIGVPLGTSQQFFLGQFLEQNGITADQVTLINVPFAQQAEALANGTIDAVISNQPTLGQIEKAVSNMTVVWSAQAGLPGYISLICTQDWAAAHQDLIERFLKALIQAQQFVVNHPDQAITAVAETLNYTNSYLTSVWSQYRFTVNLDQSFLILVRDQAQWLIANNLTDASSTPNFLNYINANGLLAVSPQSVNIIG
jgi:NitT/TauT family transport system substrate-binding protein